METLDSIFENSARSNSNNIAITFHSGSTKEEVTYRELNEKACKLAEYLSTLCEEREIVALYSKQSIGCVVSILGLLRHKGCFAPVDLQWLPHAICNFLSKLNVRFVLVEKELLEPFQRCLYHWKHSLLSAYEFVVVENKALDVNGFVLVRILSDVKFTTVSAESSDLAYIMQTSGTTGEPKAVKVSHRCIVPNVTDFREIFQLVSEDVVYLASPYTFDPFIVQMFMAFAAGAKLVIVPASVKMVPSKLCQILFDEERVTILQPTPSLMHFVGLDLIQSKILSRDSSLRVLAFGGESCPTLSTLRQWRSPGSKTLIYNLYGITEVSCWASYHHIPNNQLERETKGEADNGNLTEKSQGDFPVGVVSDVPLGLPLSNTLIEIRDENNELVKEGTGQIYIGGPDRVCLLGDETSLTARTMRSTGDWAYMENHCIWFCGRRDRQIKRMGKRINLDWIEHKIAENLLDDECSLVLDKSGGISHNKNYSRIHLFVASKSSLYDIKKLASLRNNLHNLLPVYAQPDFVHIVPKLPMTAHGKTDRDALLRSVQKSPVPKDMKTPREFLQSSWKECLEVNKTSRAVITEKIHVALSDKLEFVQSDPVMKSSEDVGEDDLFIASGGTSLEAVRLADLIESWASKQVKTPVINFPELLDIILSKSFGALCGYMESALKDQNGIDLPAKGTPMVCKAEGDSDEMFFDLNSDNDAMQHSMKLLLKRKASSSVDAASPRANEDEKSKRSIISEKNSSSGESEVNTSALRSCFCSVCRGNQWTVCKFCTFSRPIATGDVAGQAETFAPIESHTHSSFCDVSTKMNQSLSSPEDVKALGSQVTITCQWHTCLYKCIDASPLVVYSPGTCEGEVFIGSHGKIFMCIRLSDGEILWERSVGDRIESSAALSACGNYVIVGCYDGKVYVFNRSTGDTHWAFQTGATVKSSPCIDSQTGLAWVGSHDHHLYGLDVKLKQCIYAIHCGGGSCFSSPCVSHDPHLVLIATLTGRVVAVDADEHTVLWSQQCPKPVFASPLLIPSGVVCACVDGRVYCFDFQGRELWCFETGAPIFCSPTYTVTECDSSSPGYIVFGSHDKRVYCLSLDGKMQWSFTTDGQVYSSPFITQLNIKHQTNCHAMRPVTCKTRDTRHTQKAVFVLSTVGTLFILELNSGILVGSYSLPGEVFSSPVVVHQRVFLGCRNDYFYSLKVH